MTVRIGEVISQPRDSQIDKGAYFRDGESPLRRNQMQGQRLIIMVPENNFQQSFTYLFGSGGPRNPGRRGQRG
jgi:hypothetical protein